MRDVVVVGAGPAGSVLALALARAGRDVLLVDREAFPRWKVCGGCLGPAALALLDRMGLAGPLREAGARPLTTMTLRAWGSEARIPLGESVALSRSTLDHLLVSAAVDAGAEFMDGVHARTVSIPGSRVEVTARDVDGEVALRAYVVADATGLGRGLSVDGSRPAERVDPGARIGVGAVFQRPPPDLEEGELRMVLGADGYVGMVETEDGRLNLAAALDPATVARAGPGAAVRRILEDAGSELPADGPEMGWRGTPSLTRTSHRKACTRVFRVGDSASYVEPFTGEGMGWAVASGLAVSSRVEEALRGRVEAAAEGWELDHQRIVGRHQRICRLLASGLRRPRLVRAAVAALRTAPLLAEPLVRMTARVPAAGDAPPPSRAAAGGAMSAPPPGSMVPSSTRRAPGA